MPALRREPIGVSQWQRASLTSGERRARELRRRSVVTWAPVRNGGPQPVPYAYRVPRPGWAVRAIAAAEAEHGRPDGEDR